MLRFSTVVRSLDETLDLCQKRIRHLPLPLPLQQALPLTTTLDCWVTPPRRSCDRPRIADDRFLRRDGPGQHALGVSARVAYGIIVLKKYAEADRAADLKSNTLACLPPGTVCFQPVGRRAALP